MPPPDQTSPPVASSSSRARNLAAFWLLGLLNNLAYVVMLSAAHDLLTHSDSSPHNSTADHSQEQPASNPRDCNTLSTGTILLADILPAILVKTVAPFLLVSIHSRMATVCLLSGLSFLLTGLSPPGPLLFLGVACASLSSGLGEVSLLPHTQSCPGQGVLPAWASGTGAAGVLGAGSYAALTALGVGARHSLLLMLWVPVGLAMAFWVLLVPHKLPVPGQEDQEPLLEDQEYPLEDQEHPLDYQLAEGDSEEDPDLPLSVWEKLLLVSGLFKYMLPLGLVYFFEYLINQVEHYSSQTTTPPSNPQGLYELVYFPDTWLNHGAQYRAYQLTYQIGVLVSRLVPSLPTTHFLPYQSYNLLL